MAKYETNLFETSEIEYCEGNSLVDHALNSTTYKHYSHHQGLSSNVRLLCPNIFLLSRSLRSASLTST